MHNRLASTINMCFLLAPSRSEMAIKHTPNGIKSYFAPLLSPLCYRRCFLLSLFCCLCLRHMLLIIQGSECLPLLWWLITAEIISSLRFFGEVFWHNDTLTGDVLVCSRCCSCCYSSACVRACVHVCVRASSCYTVCSKTTKLCDVFVLYWWNIHTAPAYSALYL